MCYERMGKLLTSRIFIKSEVDQTNLKLGVMITWVNSIILENIHCHSNMPWGYWFPNHGPVHAKRLNFHTSCSVANKNHSPLPITILNSTKKTEHCKRERGSGSSCMARLMSIVPTVSAWQTMHAWKDLDLSLAPTHTKPASISTHPHRKPSCCHFTNHTSLTK